MDKLSSEILKSIYDTRIGYLFSVEPITEKLGLTYMEFEKYARSLHRQGLIDLYEVTGPQSIENIGLTKKGFNLVSSNHP